MATTVLPLVTQLVELLFALVLAELMADELDCLLDNEDIFLLIALLLTELLAIVSVLVSLVDTRRSGDGGVVGVESLSALNTKRLACSSFVDGLVDFEFELVLL